MLLKRAPAPGLTPVPHFADTATVLVARTYAFGPPPPALPLPFVVTLGMYDRRLTLISRTTWSEIGFGNVIGNSRVSVPNGAEFWALAAPTPPAPPDPPELADLPAPWFLFSVRWRLHL